MLAIGRANDITCDIAQDSTRVYAYGFEADIDAAEALYASLVVQMVRASDLYLKSDERKSETVERWNNLTFTYEGRPVHSTVARNNFVEGFASASEPDWSCPRHAARAEGLELATKALQRDGRPSGWEPPCRRPEPLVTLAQSWVRQLVLRPLISLREQIQAQLCVTKS